MSAFKQKMAKTGARVSVLAVLVVAALAVSGIGASSALAVECNGEFSAVKGQGSSLQKTAQGVWNTGFNGLTGCTDKVTYTSTGSGTGMEQWGYETGTGPNREWAYIGTDDAPNAGQITNMKSALGAGTNIQVIPVAQAAIAIIANPPANCTVSKITQANLEKVFNGTLKNWSELANKTDDTGTACNSSITRVVRKDPSGTTYQLKRDLFLNNENPLDNIGETWEQLQSAAKNTSWPETGGIALSAVEKPANTGGGEVAETVKNMSGTIGYVDLATAKGRTGYTILEVSNGASSFAAPYAASGEKANCASASYTVPSAARTTGSGENVNWSTVYGSALETSGYPLCTLTWDLAAKNYVTSGFSTGAGLTVRSYLREYVLEAAGQNALESNWYAKLPEGTGVSTNVLDAAKFAAEKIEK